CSRRSDNIPEAADHIALLPDWPVDDGGRFLIDPVIPKVLHGADHFAPIFGERETDPFPDCGGWIAPNFPGHVFGDKSHDRLAVELVPGQIAPGNETRADRGEVTR